MIVDIAARLSSRFGVDASREREHATHVTSASIMVPRVVFLVCSLGLLLFGMVMIYSASSIVGLTSKEYGFNPAYFVVRQAGFAALGIVLAAVLAKVDYHKWEGGLLRGIWGVLVALLVVVYTSLAGRDAYGASRWIALGPFTLQPSEFVKILMVVVGAQLARRYFVEGSLEKAEAVKHALVGIVVPLVLVVLQPDKGTTGVIMLTLIVMCYLAGVSSTDTLKVVAGLGVAAVFLSLKDEYSRARIMTMLDPTSDPYGSGYQLMQGFYAFGSGGLTGLGLGMSRQKYNYLPMAHNDFIFAIVGEELGVVGTVGMLAAFAVLLWAGLRIAENAPDVTGRLIAAGCTSMIIIQLLLNVGGVLGVFPLTGKPVPFVSYGGSSVMSSLLLVGLVTSVSLRSTATESSYERRRRQMRLTDAGDFPDGERALPDGVGALPDGAGTDVDDGSAGEARTRRRGSNKPARVPSLRPGWSVVEGGRAKAGAVASTARSASAARPANAVRPVSSAPLAGGYKRVDLGPDASERLRGRR